MGAVALSLDAFRPSRGEVRRFYSSPEWRAARAVALYRLGSACVRCQRTARVEVDHIVPVRVSWAARCDQRNLQVLCARCHRSAKRREERAW